MGCSTRTGVVGVAVLLGTVVLSAVVAVGPVDGAGAGTPLAEAGLDQQVLRGETVRLDATGSYDPDGRVVGYEWVVRVPSGTTVPPFDPHAARTAFPATAVGRYEVTLTVTDDDGKTGTDTMYVAVEAGGSGSGPATASGSGGPTPEGTGPGATVPGAGRTGFPAAMTGTACAVSTGTTGGCPAFRGTPGPDPRVDIEGPPVVRAENSYTYTAVTGGLAADRRYEWEEGDVGREHTLRFDTSGEYTTRVDVTGGEGRTAADRLRVYVAAADNERPEAEIVAPGSVSAGERVGLSVDAHDPDGRVRTTAWAPSRRVTVPTDGSSRTVRVTVTDDDGASVTDVITLTGRAWNRTTVGTDTTDVTCWFTNERQRDGRHPFSDRCIWENGNTVSETTGPSRIEDFRRNPKIDLHWRRISREKLERLEANDTSTEYGTPAASPHDEADTYGYSDDLVKRTVVGQRASVENTESFSLKGESVEDDLNGDGELNAADWDQRYRSTGDAVDFDPHAHAAEEFVRSTRDGGRSRTDEDPIDIPGRASASTVATSFGGASSDTGEPPDGVGDLHHREPTGTSSGHDSSGGDDGGGGRGGGDGDTTDDGDDTRRNPNGGGTDDRDGSAGGANGSGTAGPSRHDPSGGRVVVLP
jgi:hypothetical protein